MTNEIEPKVNRIKKGKKYVMGIEWNISYL